MTEYSDVIHKIHKKNLHILQEKQELTENVIYMVNHSCRWDMPVAASAIKDHFYWLIGKQPLNVSDRIGVILNGTIWVDRKNKLSRKQSYKKMKQFLQNRTIWEEFPVEKRRDIDMEEWHREACRRVEEYPKLNYEYEMSCIRQM